MPEEGKVQCLQTVRKAFFQNGLQPRARQELRRQNVPDLASAIVAAERMVDEMEKPTHSHKQRKGETSSKQQNGKGSERKKGEEHATKAGNKPGKPNLTKGWGCFICGGP